MVAILLFHDAYAPGQKLVGVIRHLPSTPGLKLRLLGAALVYDRTRANPKNFNATHWIGHASAMEHGTIFCDLKLPLSEADENNCCSFSTPVPNKVLPSFSSAYNTAFVTVSYGLCLHSASGEVLAVEPVTITQNAPEESGRMNKKSRLATFVTRNLNWYYHNNSSYLAATVDMDEVDNLTSGSTLSLRLHARSVQVKSLRFTVEQRLELALPYDGQPRRVKQKAVIASSIRELSSTSPSEFKKRYFITMPTLCTTINSTIISTKYTVRIQMTSARTAMLTLEIPVTMYSKGSFINGLPSPMSNPGLTPQWAHTILDSHEKNLADECAICFSEINHEFSPPDLRVKEDDHEVDVASCGTAESEDFCCAGSRPATFVAEAKGEGYEATGDKGAAPCPLSAGRYAKEAMLLTEGYDIDHGCGASSAGDSFGGTPRARGEGRDAGPSHPGADVLRSTTPDPVREEPVADAISGERFGPEGGAAIRIDDGRHPDDIAEDIMAQPPHLCSQEQLDFLYKTLRYREHAMTQGVAYASCGHAFHPLCLLEYEKHSGHRTGSDAPGKCPLCRQPYTVKHFIPDDNLRSLCLEHTLNEAIAVAESAAKDAEEKANEAVTARSMAAQAAQTAARLRQQAGSTFCSDNMAHRLSAVMRTAHAGHTGGSRVPPTAATTPVGRPATAHTSMRTPVSGRRVEGFLLSAPPVATPRPSTGLPMRRGTSHLLPSDAPTASPAAAAAAAVAAADGTAEPAGAGEPGPDFNLGAHVPVHQQLAAMRILGDVEQALSAAAEHPDVVLGIDEPEQEM